MTIQLLKIIPSLQSAMLVNESSKILNKKKSMKVKDVVGVGVGTIIGVSLIKETADFIGD